MLSAKRTSQMRNNSDCKHLSPFLCICFVNRFDLNTTQQIVAITTLWNEIPLINIQNAKDKMNFARTT